MSIEQGGTRSIRVQDNGSGIPADQIKTAFWRHATSKLRTDDDLRSIATLGFRGEALPSIAAVSVLTCVTCTADAKPESTEGMGRCWSGWGSEGMGMAGTALIPTDRGWFGV